MIDNVKLENMKYRYILMEYKIEYILPKVVFESRFRQDVDIVKMRYEAKKQKETRYKVEKILTNQ